MHFLQAINSDLSVLIVCNKTGGTIKGDIKKKWSLCAVKGMGGGTATYIIAPHILKDGARYER